MRTAFTALIIAAATTPLINAAVLEDHATARPVWDGMALSAAHYRDGATVLSPNAVPASAFVGDGQSLSRVGVIWNVLSSASVDFDLISWRFMFYESVAEFSRDPLRLSPSQPQFVHEFSAPSNPDWREPRRPGQVIQRYYAEVDVAGLGIQTVLGAAHLVSLVPDLSALPTTVSSGISFSNGSAGASGFELDWFVLSPSAVPAHTFDNGDPAYLAYRVETVPEPAFAIVTLLIFPLLRSLRRG